MQELTDIGLFGIFLAKSFLYALAGAERSNCLDRQGASALARRQCTAHNFLDTVVAVVDPTLWVALFDDRRSWANGVRRLFGSTPQWASQSRLSTSSRSLRRDQQVSTHLDR